MKKSVITLLLSLSLLSGVSLAASSASSSSLIETVLLPPNLIALSSLGAVPPAAPVEPEFSRINLNPRLVVLSSAQAILEPNFRRSDFGEAVFNASLLSIVALNVADYISTRECLKYPHLSEGNPLMKPFVKDAALFAAVKGGLTLASVLGTKALYKRSKPLGWIASLASNLALSYIVSNNFRLLRQAQGR